MFQGFQWQLLVWNDGWPRNECLSNVYMIPASPVALFSFPTAGSWLAVFSRLKPIVIGLPHRIIIRFPARNNSLLTREMYTLHFQWPIHFPLADGKSLAWRRRSLEIQKVLWWLIHLKSVTTRKVAIKSTYDEQNKDQSVSNVKVLLFISKKKEWNTNLPNVSLEWIKMWLRHN